MNTCSFSPCLGQSQIPWVGITYCLGQSETNTYFISPCLIGYQIGTHVGRKSIRPLRVYRLPFRPLQGVWWGVCNTPLPFWKKIRFPWAGITYCLGQWRINTYFIPSCLIGYQIGTRVGRKSIRPLHVYRLSPRPLRGVWWGVCFCAPTLPEKDEVSSGRYFPLSRTIRDKYVFHFSMSNRLSDGYRVGAYCIRPI